jgi:hypothetical protein
LLVCSLPTSGPRRERIRAHGTAVYRRSWTRARAKLTEMTDGHCVVIDKTSSRPARGPVYQCPVVPNIMCVCSVLAFGTRCSPVKSSKFAAKLAIRWIYQNFNVWLVFTIQLFRVIHNFMIRHSDVSYFWVLRVPCAAKGGGTSDRYATGVDTVLLDTVLQNRQ